MNDFGSGDSSFKKQEILGWTIMLLELEMERVCLRCETKKKSVNKWHNTDIKWENLIYIYNRNSLA